MFRARGAAVDACGEGACGARGAAIGAHVGEGRRRGVGRARFGGAAAHHLDVAQVAGHEG